MNLDDVSIEAAEYANEYLLLCNAPSDNEHKKPKANCLRSSIGK
jgi:hypothetical protein